MERRKSKEASKIKKFINQLLGLYSIARYTSHEILLEENLQNAGASSSVYLENFGKNKRSLKIQVLIMKIFYAFLFAILPAIPLVTFINLIQFVEILDINVLILTGSLIFSIFFILDLLNLILMSMINVTTLMSGRIFHWFETLPISRKKFQNLGFMTIFRSLDIPLLAFASIFPALMLIGTLNLLLFLVCVGISFLNIIFSFSVMILVGKKLTKVINVYKGNSKKALFFRAINLLGFLFITLGSVYLVQWAFGYLGTIFDELIDFNAEFLNLILSLIPFPLNLGYIISIIADPLRIPALTLINILIGFGLFLILTRFLYIKARNAMNNVLRTSFEDTQTRGKDVKNFDINVKSKSPLISYIKKDLITSTRDIQTLMVFILPLVISFVFTIAYLGGRSSGANLLLYEELVYYWMVLLIFHPIISFLLVYGLLNTEQSGETILASLPIVPRDQAKAKLIILAILQTISVFLPSLIFTFDYKLPYIIFVSFLALPFIYLFLLITFLLRISYFGKIDDYYVIEEVYPEDKTQKWGLIFIFVYAFNFWIVSLTRILFYFNQMEILTIILTISCIAGYIGCFTTFNKMFHRFYPEIDKIKFYHPWITSIGISITFMFYLILLTYGIPSILYNFIQFILYSIFSYSPHYTESIIFYLIAIFIAVLFFLRLIPRMLRKKVGDRKNFYSFIGLPLKKEKSKKIFSYLILGLIIALTIKYINLLSYEQDLNGLLRASNDLIVFKGLLDLFWFELVFRGIIFNIFQTKYSAKFSIIFSLFIQFSTKYLFTNLFNLLVYQTVFFYFPLLYEILLSMGIQLILYIIYYKSGNNLVASSISAMVFQVFMTRGYSIIY